jgi:hypothetical protein
VITEMINLPFRHTPVDHVNNINFPLKTELLISYVHTTGDNFV